MKRFVLKFAAMILLAIFTASIFAGCESNKATVSEYSDSNENKFVSPFRCYIEKSIYSGEHGVTLPYYINLSDSEQSYITEILNNGNWTEYMVCDCKPEYQYKLIFDNVMINYTSEGRFYYGTAELNASDDEVAEINRILESKIVLSMNKDLLKQPLKGLVLQSTDFESYYVDVLLTDDEQKYIIDTLIGREWEVNSPCECMPECEFVFEDITIYYSPESGAYYCGYKASTVLAEERQRINEIIAVEPSAKNITYEGAVLCKHVKYNSNFTVELDENEQAQIISILNSDREWKNGIVEKGYTLSFEFGDTVVYYLQSDRVVTDVTGGTFSLLTQEEAELINAMIAEY